VDFLFRLGLLTPFCYSKLALVEIDRDANRSVGLTTSFPPTSSTAMLETESLLRKWLSLLDDSHAQLRAIVKHQLVLQHSGLANRYILAGDSEGARQVLRKGLKYSYDMRLAVKWFLARTIPGVFRRFLSARAPVEFSTTQATAPVSKPVVRS
jgi:hypothetical protein